MYKIAVMGDRDSIYGFAALGLNPFPADNYDEGIATLRKLVDDNYGIIYITEKLANMIQHEIDKYVENELPAIILIPGISGNTGNGIMAVKKSVEQAVGSDIIFGNGG